jgi:hypothetical protein
VVKSGERGLGDFCRWLGAIRWARLPAALGITIRSREISTCP